MFGQIYNYENKLFVSGQEILGVESVEMSYGNSANVNKFLGFSVGNTIVNGPTQQKINIARNLIYNDPLMAYTGDIGMSGSLNYQNSAYGFVSGFLDDYSVNCAVGAVPKISTNFTIYGEMKSGTNMSGSVAAPTIHIPNQGSISLTCDNSSTNRVVGFDYAVKISRKPVYVIGSKFPVTVSHLGPLEFSASVQIDVDDAFLKDSMHFLSGRQNKTVNFTVKSRDKTTTLQSLSIPNASLVGETLSSSADGGLKLTLNYIGHL